MTSLQEEDLKTLKRYEKDHFLGPFVGINPEYMEMSESWFYHLVTFHSRQSFILIYEYNDGWHFN